MEGHSKIKLEPAKLPMVVEDGPLAQLLTAVQSVTAAGTASLQPGRFAFDDGNVATFKEDTTATFHCELALQTKPGSDGQVLLWPQVKKFSARFSRDVAVIRSSGSPLSLGGFDLGSTEDELETNAHVRLRNTLGLALTKLTTRAPQAQQVQGPADVVKELYVPQMQVELEAGASLEFGGQQLVVSGGKLEVLKLTTSVTDKLTAATVRTDVALGPGSRLAHDGVTMMLSDSRLVFEAFVEARDAEVDVVATGSSPGHGLHIRTATVTLPEGRGTLVLNPSQLSFQHLAYRSGELRTTLQGSLALAVEQLLLGPMRLASGSGRVGAAWFSIGDPNQPSVVLKEVTLEQASMTVADRTGGRIEIKAASLSFPHATSEAGAVDLAAEHAVMTFDDGKGRMIRASSEPSTTIAVQTPHPLVLGEPTPADGLRFTGAWERLEIDFGQGPMTVQPAGLELHVVRHDPLKIEANVHTDNLRSDELEQGLTASNIHLTLNKLSRTGTAALSSAVPFGYILEAINRTVPSVVNIEFPADVVDQVVEALKSKRRGLARRMKDLLRVAFEMSGHHQLSLATVDRELRVQGEVVLTAIAYGPVGRYAAALSRLRSKEDKDASTAQAEIVRQAYPIPVEGVLRASTNAPASAEDLVLQLQPQLRAPSTGEDAINRLGELVAAEMSKQPLSVALLPLLSTQLTSAAKSAEVRTATVDPQQDALAVSMKVAVPSN